MVEIGKLKKLELDTAKGGLNINIFHCQISSNYILEKLHLIRTEKYLYFAFIFVLVIKSSQSINRFVVFLSDFWFECDHQSSRQRFCRRPRLVHLRRVPEPAHQRSEAQRPSGHLVPRARTLQKRNSQWAVSCSGTVPIERPISFEEEWSEGRGVY